MEKNRNIYIRSKNKTSFLHKLFKTQKELFSLKYESNKFL